MRILRRHRALIEGLLLVALPVVASAQQPAPTPQGATPLSAEAQIHALERDNAALQLQVLESRYQALRREYETKAAAAETALGEEAAKAKVDVKAFRADPASKTWRKVQ